MRVVSIDLDDAGDVLRLWHEAERVAELRGVDPWLRRNMLHWLPRMTEETAAEIRIALDEVVPAAVLEGFWSEFCTVIPGLVPPRRPDGGAR